MASKSETRLAEVKKSLATKFDIKDLGGLHHFLGMKVIQDETARKVCFGQQAYTEKLLKVFGMEKANPVATPVDTSNKLVKATESEECVHQQEYQSAVGSLLYLVVATSPDNAFALSNVTKFSAQLTKQAPLGCSKTYSTLPKGHCRLRSSIHTHAPGECLSYSDADWGGDLNDRKSTSGYLFKVSGGAVSWMSKK